MYKHIEPKVTRRAMTNNHHSIQEVNEIPVNIYTVHFSKITKVSLTRRGPASQI